MILSYDTTTHEQPEDLGNPALCHADWWHWDRGT